MYILKLILHRKYLKLYILQQTFKKAIINSKYKIILNEY